MNNTHTTELNPITPVINESGEAAQVSATPDVATNV